jgi:hypothetical protein
LTRLFAAFRRSQSGLVPQLDGRGAAVREGRCAALWRPSARGTGERSLPALPILRCCDKASCHCFRPRLSNGDFAFVAQWLLNATQPSGVFLPRAAIRDDTAAVFCLFTGTPLPPFLCHRSTCCAFEHPLLLCLRLRVFCAESACVRLILCAVCCVCSQRVPASAIRPRGCEHARADHGAAAGLVPAALRLCVRVRRRANARTIQHQVCCAFAHARLHPCGSYLVAC